MSSITSKVRENIPVVLKKSGKAVSEKELLELLAQRIPSLIKEDGELRKGVLRGILNKLNSIPVDNLHIQRSKDTNKILYSYIDGKKDKIKNRISSFCEELRNDNLLTADFLNDSQGTIQFIKDVTKIVKQLETINETTYR